MTKLKLIDETINKIEELYKKRDDNKMSVECFVNEEMKIINNYKNGVKPIKEY